MITRSSHSFGPGKANTRIDAVWVSEMARKEDESAKEAKEVEKEEKLTKCSIDRLGKFTFAKPRNRGSDTVATSE